MGGQVFVGVDMRGFVGGQSIYSDPGTGRGVELRVVLECFEGFVRGVFIFVVTALILKSGYDAFLR